MPWSHGPWHPLGGDTLSRGSQGNIPLLFPRCVPDGPPNTRGPLEVLVGIVLGELDSSTPRVDHSSSIFLHVVVRTCTCFFFEIPPFEELQDPDSSPRREEVGRRTLGDYGGFLLPFFYRDRFHLFTRVELAR